MAIADDQVSAERLKITEMDGFGGRHSLSAATWKGGTILFGGQDVMEDKVLNEVFVYHNEKNELEKIEYLQDAAIGSEFAGEFFLSLGDKNRARKYLNKARKFYQEVRKRGINQWQGMTASAFVSHRATSC